MSGPTAIDRELDDIFAIQDEISKAIVGALKVKLLPEEKKAIETRGTASVEAYNLYLMARQQWTDLEHWRHPPPGNDRSHLQPGDLDSIPITPRLGL